MTVTFGEYTTYYWYCEDCREGEDFDGEGAALVNGKEHECYEKEQDNE